MSWLFVLWKIQITKQDQKIIICLEFLPAFHFRFRFLQAPQGSRAWASWRTQCDYLFVTVTHTLNPARVDSGNNKKCHIQKLVGTCLTIRSDLWAKAIFFTDLFFVLFIHTSLDINEHLVTFVVCYCKIKHTHGNGSCVSNSNFKWGY